MKLFASMRVSEVIKIERDMRYQSEPELLFYKASEHAVQQHHEQQAREEVTRLDAERVLQVPVADLVTYVRDKFVIDVPTLDRENAVVDQREGQVPFYDRFDRYDAPQTVPGTIVSLEVPFSGERECFFIQPNPFSMNPPRAVIGNAAVHLTYKDRSPSAAEVQRSFNSTLDQIETYLDSLRKNFANLPSRIEQVTTQALEARKAKLLADRQMVSGLSFKVRERPDAPRTYDASPKRVRIRQTPPPASGRSYVPEPVLDEQTYAHILKVMESMNLVMERSPSAFASMGEEDLRQHYLVQLNGHFEGEASGETFNAAGKTDILIRHDNRNIFIAECKFWGGPKVHIETIDQILGYLSWRDTKAAIVVFNRNKDFGKVLESIKETTSNHPSCKLGPTIEGETRFRYTFGSKGDPNRELFLTILASDIPVLKTASG